MADSIDGESALNILSNRCRPVSGRLIASNGVLQHTLDRLMLHVDGQDPKQSRDQHPAGNDGKYSEGSITSLAMLSILPVCCVMGASFPLDQTKEC